MKKKSNDLIIYLLFVLGVFSLLFLIFNGGEKKSIKYYQIIDYFKNDQVYGYDLKLGSGDLSLVIKEKQEKTEKVLYEEPDTNLLFAKPDVVLKQQKLFLQDLCKAQISGIYRDFESNKLVINKVVTPAVFRRINYKLPNVDIFLFDIKDYVKEHNTKFPEQTIKVDYKRTTTSMGILLQFLFNSILPIVVLIIGWVFISRYVSKGSMHDIGGFKSKAIRYMDKGPKVTFEDVAALLEEKAELQDILEFLKNPNKFDEIGARIPTGILMVGPPGTGKTSVALKHMVEIHMGERHNILLLAYTNRAVDEICGMLATIDPEPDYIRLGRELSCATAYQEHLLVNTIAQLTNRQLVREKIENTSIFVSTVASMNSHTALFKLKHFHVAIFDEASQILEPQILGILTSPSISKFIMIGDHKQLPAVVVQNEEKSVVESPLLHAIGLTNCRNSLFERLYEQNRANHDVVSRLDHQGRMHPEVAQFPCTHFYVKENLQPVPLVHQKETGPIYHVAPEDALDETLSQQRVLFFDQESGAAALLQRIHRLCGKGFSAATSAGIIVTYRNQISQIRQEIEQCGIPELCSVCIDTVERYQGSQRDVIIYDFGINNLYQLDFLTANTFMEDGLPIDRKLNVAMTRARRQLILIGRASLLRHNPLLREIIEKYNLHYSQKCIGVSE